MSLDLLLKADGDVQNASDTDHGQFYVTATFQLKVKDSVGGVHATTAVLADGDYGAITITAGAWAIDAGAVSTTQLGGDITTAGKALLDDADAAAQRVTLGLAIGINVQAYDATLAALAGANWAQNAFPIGTGADTLSQVTFAANTFPARASTGDLVAKTITDAALTVLDDTTVGAMLTTLGGQPLDATLTAIAAYNTNGIVTQTAADTFTGRTITGTSNEITVANGSGVAGNPTLSLPATIDLGGKTSFEIPNSAAPTVDADGEIAVDTTVTDFSHGLIKYFSGEEVGVVAMPIAQFSSPTSNYVVAYDATADEFQLKPPSIGGGGAGGLLDYKFVRKTSDESVTSSVALQDDDHLFFSIGANETWIVDFVLGTSGALLGDVKVAINAPAGATGATFGQGLAVGSTSNEGSVAIYRSAAITDSETFGHATVPGNFFGSRFTAIVVNSTNAGTVKLRWAQLVSSLTATQVLTNSYLEARRVG